MGINMGTPKTSSQSKDTAASEIYEVSEYNIVEEKNMMLDKYVGSEEIDRLVSTICVDDTNTIVNFGNGAAENIAKCSDMVLRSMDMTKINESGEMLVLLSKIMDKFNLEEIKDNNGVLQRLFGNMKKQLDKILAKYHTMGEEIDKVYVKLKSYENEINQSNRNLQELFEANVEYYDELIKYIVAGEQGIGELDEYIAQRREEWDRTGDNSIQFELTSLEQAKQLLEQRVHDLRISENVALQSIPMLKTMQFSNLNLIRKINSAFIITLPVFKQALAQAIMLKRQRIQAEAMSALDEKTN
ncbi:MAG: toxic anion resistance protein, partial [Oscillospiraceae bacterium]|nr:toxic anion resistance protein [Oscillospiraceae bacterium]